MTMTVPLHLHTLWIAIVYLGVLLACLLVVLTIGYGWRRWNRDGLDGRSRDALVLVSGLGIVLSGLFWVPALLSPLLGSSNVLLEYPDVMLVYSLGFSSSGVAGGYVLWRLRRDRIRGQPREAVAE